MIHNSQPQDFDLYHTINPSDEVWAPAKRIQDPEDGVRRLQQVLSVRRLRAQPWRQAWHQGWAMASLDAPPLLAMQLPPCSAQVDAADAQQLTAIHIVRGNIRLRQRRSSWLAGPGSCVLLSPAPFVLRSGTVSCVVITLNKQQIQREGARLLGVDRPPRPWRPLLEDSDGLLLSAQAAASGLDDALGHALAMVADLSCCLPSLPERLGSEALVHQLVALMLFPELRRRLPLERLADRSRQGRDAFDDLLEDISNHLHEPLNIDWLVQTSHYSARTLQYKFRQRLGCTATDWIRIQRLDRARRRLQHPRPGDTVASIASECGYRSVNLFSVDFQQRFLVRPSDLLREVQRRHQDPDDPDPEPLSG